MNIQQRYIVHEFKRCGYMPEKSFDSFEEAVSYVEMLSNGDRLSNNMTSSQYKRYEQNMKPLIEASFTGFYTDCFNYCPKDGLDHKKEVLDYVMNGSIQLSHR